MRVLAFDTATAATTVGLRDVEAGIELEVREDPVPGGRPGHARQVLDLIREVLTVTATGWKQIDRIAVGRGPGTFTGMRIGIATAQALAQSTGVPLVGVSTLAALQLAASQSDFRSVLAVIDARRGEVFVSGADLAPCVLTPAQLGDATRRLGDGRTGFLGGRWVARPSSSGVAAVGDGAVRFRETLERAGAFVPADSSPLHKVNAIHHCRLALDAIPATGNTVEPEYLRVPDAELTARA